MTRKVCIVGSGIIGLSSAYYLAKAGCEVTVIEKQSAERNGCSYGNAGMIVPSHFVPLAAPGMVALGLKMMWNSESPFYIKPRLSWDLISWGWKFWKAANKAHVEASAPLLRDLNHKSRALYKEFAQTDGFQFGLVEKGLVMLCKTERTLHEEGEMAKKARSIGVQADVLDAQQLKDLDPNIDMNVQGGVYFPGDCHLSPNQFMSCLQKSCEKMGVRFLWGTEVKRWHRSGRYVASVETNSEVIKADSFVLAGGAWTTEIGKELGLYLPMQAGKGYSLTLANPPQLPTICSILTEARVAVTPMGNTLRVGGTMEIAGIDDKVNMNRVRGIIKSVPNYYPKFSEKDFEKITPWYGLRPCSPDGLPYVGHSNGTENLVIATGHAMMGLSLGPVTGLLVSELAQTTRPSIDIKLLSPDRFR